MTLLAIGFAALIGVFHLCVGPWTESIVSCVRAPANHHSTADSRGILVDNNAAHKGGAQASGPGQHLTGDDLPHDEAARRKLSFPQGILSHGHELSGCEVGFHRNYAFDNATFCSPPIHQDKGHYRGAVFFQFCPKHLTHHQFWPMSGVELVAAKSYRFTRNEPESKGEHRDGDGREGGNQFPMSLRATDNFREKIREDIIAGALFLMGLLYFAYLAIREVARHYSGKGSNKKGRW